MIRQKHVCSLIMMIMTNQKFVDQIKINSLFLEEFNIIILARDFFFFTIEYHQTYHTKSFKHQLGTMIILS